MREVKRNQMEKHQMERREMSYGILNPGRTTFFAVCAIAIMGLFGAKRSDLHAASVPDKIVVLTFDDSAKSHFTVVRPILKKYGFGATFFITEGFDFVDNKRDYMTWDQIAQLHHDGFEIGNHTRDHLGISDATVGQLIEQLAAIDGKCRAHGIPKPTSFAWPGNATSLDALPLMKQHGLKFARRGGAPEYPYEQGRGFAYEPGLDHPLLLPSAGDARPDWELSDFIRAVSQARHGKIAVLQFHGVPDTAHAWVNTSRENFEAYMNYLAVHDYQVIAMRDLARYVDQDVTPSNPTEVIEDRKQRLANGLSFTNFRRPESDESLHYWLRNMLTHDYDLHEMAMATGLSHAELKAGLSRLQLDLDQRPLLEQATLTVLPYPGGRHPRIGFLDGAIRPQRETKVSIFCPWDTQSYVVADTPEAIWWRQGEQRELLYLAHTHVPTHWDKKGVVLKPLEWTRHEDGRLEFSRQLPNGVSFGTIIRPEREAVRMEMWIRNGTSQPISDLVVQNCIMLKGAAGFDSQTVDNKMFRTPYAACGAPDGMRWVITAWQNCVRPWGNDACPCLHSDPRFPDCQPGETQRLQGWLSFYEGDDLKGELERIDRLKWHETSLSP